MEYMAENKTNDLTLGFNMAGYWHKESRVQKLDVSLKESVANVRIRQLSLKEQYLKSFSITCLHSVINIKALV